MNAPAPTGNLNPNQHTEEWLRSRIGKFTGSRMHTVMEGGPKAHATLLDDIDYELSIFPLLHDRFAGRSVPYAIRFGWEYEGEALAQAEFDLNTTIERPGFKQHPTIPYIGASSDGIIPGVASVEVKCRISDFWHNYVIVEGKIPPIHMAQVQCQMDVWELDLTYFMSYKPDVAAWEYRCRIIEGPRYEAYVRRMRAKCTELHELRLAGKRPTTASPTLPSFTF